MNQSLRRAAAFAAVSMLSLAAPVLGRAVAAPFIGVALGAFAITDGPMFDVFSTAHDRRKGRLRTLLGFTLAASGLGIFVWLLSLPVDVFVASVLIVGFGDLGRRLVLEWQSNRARSMAGFVVLGALAALAGQIFIAAYTGKTAAYPRWVFLAASGALLAGILRTVFVTRDDPLVLFSVALLLWLFSVLAPLNGVPTGVAGERVAIALVVTVLFGLVSRAMGATSVAGMLTGVFLGLLAVVLGGYGWFVVLFAFFAIGSLITKFRYDQKFERGVAEENDGTRGTGNVLGNSAPALIALLLYAAHAHVPLSPTVYLFAYVGSMATALADTFSSEVGGLFDKPRLVTSLEPVEPGTDGAVTWQGELAGVVGALLIAAIGAVVFSFDTAGVVVVLCAGIAGISADSLAGATIENTYINNQGVNFLATLTGGVVGGVLAMAIGLA